jgi:uncharacterized protein (TIGR02284 family)
MAQQKEIVSTINNLIETLKDGQEGFRQAAEAVKDPQLKSLFSSYSQQRARFATELENKVSELGETPETSSSAPGAVHRAWINLKSVMTSGDDAAILSEAERGEDVAVKEFKEAMDDELSAPLRDVVSKQYREVQNAHDRIKMLRDTAKKM